VFYTLRLLVVAVVAASRLSCWFIIFDTFGRWFIAFDTLGRWFIAFDTLGRWFVAFDNLGRWFIAFNTLISVVGSSLSTISSRLSKHSEFSRSSRYLFIFFKLDLYDIKAPA
jgi:hypothetical protein